MGFSNGTSPIPSSNQTDVNSVFTRQVLPVLYLLICVVGLVLNFLAAYIFFRMPSSSALIVYLKNMVVADLLMLLTFPWRIASEAGLGGRALKELTCRYTAVVFYLSMYAGILFMGLISLERYVKIVHSSSSSSAISSSSLPSLGSLCSVPSCSALLRHVHFARGLSLLAWMLLLLCMLPNTFLSNRVLPPESKWSCMKLKSDLGAKWHQVSSLLVVGVFWATLLLLAFCYASIALRVYRSYRRMGRGSGGNHQVRRKSNRSILSILAVFFICFVPYHVCRVPYTLSQFSPSYSFSDASRYILFQAKEATLFLASLNVCLDPIIYFLMCRTFRESLLQKLPCWTRPTHETMRRGSFSNGVSISNIL